MDKQKNEYSDDADRPKGKTSSDEYIYVVIHLFI
jgi:hypothetical protein